MTKLILTFIFFLQLLTLQSQDFKGDWYGVLKVQGLELPLLFHVEKSGDDYKTTMDSPQQGATNIPVTITIVKDSNISFEIIAAKIKYDGILKNDIIIGTFNQNGQSFTLNLSHQNKIKEVIKKPQEPIAPYPYYSEEVIFNNAKDEVKLAGTLTLPTRNGNYPVIILISGSGPQNRDCELLGHKSFLVISDFLTRNGIGVLRFDDRGVGASTGSFQKATSADFVTDVESAIAYLKTRSEVNKNQIGLLGHSEGGLIATIIGSKSNFVDFIVLVASPGIPGDELLLLQKEKIERASGLSEKEITAGIDLNRRIFNKVTSSKNDTQLKNEIYSTLVAFNEEQTSDEQQTDNEINTIVETITSPWFYYFLNFKPIPSLEKIKCPVLVLAGEKDLQVPSLENIASIEKAFKKGKKSNFKTVVYPKLNHLFQEAETGLPGEYATIEETFSPKALEEIKNWLQNTLK